MTSMSGTAGRITIPVSADGLDAITDVGAEDHSDIDSAAIDRIWAAARYWYRSGLHPAIQVCLRHNGKVVLNRAIGHGWGNGPNDPPDAERIRVRTDTPFCVYSAAKGITATVMHRLVERLPAELHQPRQTSHHHPARHDPQRWSPVLHGHQA